MCVEACAVRIHTADFSLFVSRTTVCGFVSLKPPIFYPCSNEVSSAVNAVQSTRKLSEDICVELAIYFIVRWYLSILENEIRAKFP